MKIHATQISFNRPADIQWLVTNLKVGYGLDLEQLKDAIGSGIITSNTEIIEIDNAESGGIYELPEYPYPNTVYHLLYPVGRLIFSEITGFIREINNIQEISSSNGIFYIHLNTEDSFSFGSKSLKPIYFTHDNANDEPDSSLLPGAEYFITVRWGDRVYVHASRLTQIQQSI